MNGAESLLRTLANGGVDTCFANPGTSELHFVSAFDRVPEMRSVLCLFEGVASGCADGYARMTGRPACTLLHCGPGLGYAVTNLHNARRAASPIVNIVGDHATYHRPLDPPLASDIETLARPFSAWVRTARDAATLGADAAAALACARTAPGQIATLVAPSDTAWGEGGYVGKLEPAGLPPAIDEAQMRAVGDILRRNESVLLLLNGAALRDPALARAHAIAQHCGARLMADFTNGRYQRGRGRAKVARMPWNSDHARTALASIRHLVLVGARSPVAFFAYPGQPRGLLADDCVVHALAKPDHDLADALHRLADIVGAPREIATPDEELAPLVDGPVTPTTLAAVLSACMPENAIVVDESVSFGRGIFSAVSGAPPHDWLHQTGGALGCGGPLAAGAAIGAPGRRVIVLQADGSALYTPQALWTQAREKLDVTTLILANRKYAVLEREFALTGATPGAASADMIDIGRPAIDFVALANAVGMEAARADSVSRVADLIRTSNRRRGPFLVEVAI